MDYKKLLEIVIKKKEKLDTFRPFNPQMVKNLNQWYSVNFTYNSNALEGNTLTQNETAIVIEKGLTIGGKTLKEHLEATNGAIAFNFINDLVQKKHHFITLNDILDIHRIILKGIDDDNAGKYRKIDVKISGSNLLLPNPIKIPDLMNDFISWFGSIAKNNILISIDAHYRLVKIHPFIDGNGRTARLLMNLILMSQGYPPAVIEKEQREYYIKALEKIDNSEDYSDLYILVLKALEKSLDIYLEFAQNIIK